MKRLVCLLLAAVMAMSLAACGSSSQGASSGAASAEAGSHDTLTVAIQKEPKSLIPYGSNDTGTSYITSQIYDKLLTTDADGNLVADLATSWEQVDETHYRFVLRDDVTFSNGEALTADDVIYSFTQAAAAEATSSTIGPLDPANCKAEDDHTVILALTQAYPAFLHVCSLDIAAIVCKSAMEADPDGYATNPIGSGPFILDEWATGDYLKFSANPNYWGGKINFKTLMLRYIAEDTTRSVEAESGGVDIAQIVVSDAQSTSESSVTNLVTRSILNTSFVSFNCSKEPFNNVKVRQAISLALDTKAIVDATYYGYTDVAQSFLAPTIWGYSDAESEYKSYNVEKAKALLAEAGYPNGFSCTLTSNGKQSAAEMIQAYLAEIGITVTLNVTDFSNWLDALVNGKQEMYIGGWTVPSGDPSEAFAYFDSANFGSGGNRSFYSNPEADALIKKINTQTDDTARMESCKELQELLASECVTIGLENGVTFYAVNKSIDGFYVLATQSPVFWQITFTD